jgi:multicomponent Na+:H+ antiporter subunit B
MSTLIFRTAAPLIVTVMALFSVVILLRGHNDPGGGFIAGLIAASAAAIYGMAFGVGGARKLLRINPAAYAGAGLLIAIASGLLSLFAADPFLTGLWLPGHIFGTPGLFDIGVYLVVFGSVTAIALALEDGGEGEGS